MKRRRPGMLLRRCFLVDLAHTQIHRVKRERQQEQEPASEDPRDHTHIPERLTMISCAAPQIV